MNKYLVAKCPECFEFLTEADHKKIDERGVWHEGKLKMVAFVGLPLKIEKFRCDKCTLKYLIKGDSLVSRKPAHQH